MIRVLRNRSRRLRFLWKTALRRPWNFARFNQTFRFRNRYRDDRPVVLVHQMAKVGSMSVFRTLEDVLADRYVFHTHYLNPDTVDAIEDTFRRFYARKGWVWFYDEFLAAELLKGRLPESGGGAVSPNRRVKVVSLIRDPVARNISSFFQHLQFEHPEWSSGKRRDLQYTDDLIDLFLNGAESTHSFPLDWFDREVRDVFDIDVFATPFPHDRGYEIYHGPAADLLVIRLEDLTRCGEQALREFFELDDLTLRDENRADNKDYAPAYRRFKNEIVMPEDYLDRMYESRFGRHFYTDKERNRFRSKWETQAALMPDQADGASKPAKRKVSTNREHALANLSEIVPD